MKGCVKIECARVSNKMKKTITTKLQYETSLVTVFMGEDVITTICINSCELYKLREVGAYNVISDVIDELQIIQERIEKEGK
jgi:hypothetical protein